MKTLVRSDFRVQLFILLAAGIAAIFHAEWGAAGFYFGLGGWQTFMAIMHFFSPQPNQGAGRDWYQVILFLVALINGIVALLFSQEYLSVALGMLVVGPIMAVWNLIVSYNEGQKLQNKHNVWNVE